MVKLTLPVYIVRVIIRICCELTKVFAASEPLVCDHLALWKDLPYNSEVYKKKERMNYYTMFFPAGLTRYSLGMSAGNHSLYVMCCILAATIRRASWNSFSSPHDGFRAYRRLAIRLCSRTHRVCIAIKAVKQQKSMVRWPGGVSTFKKSKTIPFLRYYATVKSQSSLARIRFPALGVTTDMYLHRVLIGPLYCLCPFWLVRVMTLIFVLRNSFEKPL